MEHDNLDRRKFIKTIPAIATISTGLAAYSCQPTDAKIEPTRTDMPDEIKIAPIENVRIGFVGLGVRGSNHIRKLLKMKGCQIVCVCDIIPEKVEKIQKWSTDKGFPEPKGYSKDDVDYRRMCENEEFDLLITATPWELHASICIAGMENGKHAATEVPGCTSIDACWALVEASEKYQRHCMLLENYCYFQEILAVDNMLREGLFGNPMHVYAGYQKEAMYYQMTSDGKLTFSGEGHDNAYGNVYPTHHAGPSAKWMNVNRGDRFDYLVSMGCGNVAFNQYAKERFGPDHPLAKRKFNMADISNTMIMTKEGRTLHLILDTILPRPGRHYFRLQAERGIYENIERRVHIHNVSPGKYTGLESNPYANKRHWESIDNYLEEYDHPIWKKFHKDDLKEAGHAGADYVILRKLINGFNLGVYPDIDVYDLAAWSCLVEVSEVSARNRSKAIDIPDFTRGKWKTRKPLPILI